MFAFLIYLLPIRLVFVLGFLLALLCPLLSALFRTSRRPAGGPADQIVTRVAVWLRVLILRATGLRVGGFRGGGVRGGIGITGLRVGSGGGEGRDRLKGRGRRGGLLGETVGCRGLGIAVGVVIPGDVLGGRKGCA